MKRITYGKSSKQPKMEKVPQLRPDLVKITALIENQNYTSVAYKIVGRYK